jgi:hypothetical protein
MSSANLSDQLWGWLIEASVQCVSEDISLGTKRSVREADHSPSYAFIVRNRADLSVPLSYGRIE